MALRGEKLETDQCPKKVSHRVAKHRLHLVVPPKDNLIKGKVELPPFPLRGAQKTAHELWWQCDLRVSEDLR